jgi:tetratricopeptide (TPR) repeat protein
MLVPVSGLVQTGSQAFADRYAYLPSVGLFLALAGLIGQMAPRGGTRPTGWRGLLATVLVGGGSCVLVLLAAASWRQIGYWRNTEVLYRHAVSVVPGNYEAMLHLAGYLDDRKRIAEAREWYMKALEVRRTGFVLYRLGLLAVAERQLDLAENYYQEALKLEPDRAEAYQQLGRLYTEKEMPEKARQHLERAVSLKPDWVTALQDLAWFLATEPTVGAQGGEQAVALARRAMGLEPTNTVNLAILAGAYAKAGNFEEAIKVEEQAIGRARAAAETNVLARCQKYLELFRRKEPARDE